MRFRKPYVMLDPSTGESIGGKDGPLYHYCESVTWTDGHTGEIRSDVRAIGYCAQGCEGHDKPEDAVEHYKLWALHNLAQYDGKTDKVLRPCRVCNLPTDGYAYTLTDIRSHANQISLCDRHRTPSCYASTLRIGEVTIIDEHENTQNSLL